MKKILFLTASAIAMLASCSQNDLEAPVVAEAQQSAVEFGTYLGKAATSRAGYSATDMDDLALKDRKADDSADETRSQGFGVFAYYTGDTQWASYTPVATEGPNFMYNTQVRWDNTNTKWTYTDVRYWPNENQPADDESATGVDKAQSYLSFFAYAPYVSVTKTTGEVTENSTWGITKLSANNATEKGPYLYYTLDNDHPVDFVYGTRGAATYQEADGTDNNGTVGTDFNVDLTKQKVGEKVNFLFKHALAKFGGNTKDANENKLGLLIQLDIDDWTNETGGTKGANTRVTVKNIKITPEKTTVDGNDVSILKKNDIFNLSTGAWLDKGTDAATNIASTDYFAENTALVNLTYGASTKLATAIAEPATVSEWSHVSGITGVTTDKQNVYQDAASTLLYPLATGKKFDVEIEYVVRTKDDNLAKGYTEVTQKVKKQITFGSAVEAGKFYTLVIHLGLTEVKFVASVSAWDSDINGDNDDTNDEQVVNLPINVK
ncbi:MAG: hypothetical protein IJV19_03070 [Prevotella sp.]|nr:hypothetical protein [Prevotella sp.]